jgi:signal transduction histidine kinase
VAVESALKNALRLGDQFLVRKLIKSINTDSEYEDIKLREQGAITSWKILNNPYLLGDSKHGSPSGYLISYVYPFEGLPDGGLVFEKSLPVKQIITVFLAFLILTILLFKIAEGAIFGLVRELVKPIELFANELVSTEAECASVDQILSEIDCGGSYQELDQAIVRVKQMAKQVQALERSQAESKKDFAVAELAKSVAHDIRSPLSAIAAGISRIENVDPQLFELISAANSRLQDIASNLLVAHKTRSAPVISRTDSVVDKPIHSFCLRQAIDNVVGEKQLEFGDRDVVFIVDSIRYSGDLCLGSKAEFERMLSNLLNNSVQALVGHGFIKITLFTSGAYHQLRIEDNGCGIPQDYLARIGERNFSYGKTDGNGVGVFYAKQLVTSMKGRFEISSLQNVGTRVSINLPA